MYPTASEVNAKMAQTDARAFAGAGGIQAGNQISADPASLRQQIGALYTLCERLSTQRSRLADIADSILGGEPESANSPQGKAMPVGGLTAEIVGGFESAGSLLNQIDRQIDRLQRVSQ